MASHNSSRDMFDDSEELVTAVAETEDEEDGQAEHLPEVKKPRTESENEPPWCTNLTLPKLIDNSSSASTGPKAMRSKVMVRLPLEPGQTPVAHPIRRTDDCWDENHVRMPNSQRSQFPVVSETGHKRLESRWALIHKALATGESNRIKTSYDLEARILSYNMPGRWDFSGLKELIDESWSDDDRATFFDRILPGMQRLALRLDDLVTQPIPLLRRGHNQSLTLSQVQVASLLANAFFCTFPRRNAGKKNSEYANYPYINFNRLFERGNEEKLNCMFNYFRRVTCEESESGRGLVTFTRRFVSPFALPDWRGSQVRLGRLKTCVRGRIEDEGEGMLQVDFANAYVGGGVLGHGCVQEEIRFLICPELISSMLFTERLGDSECLVMYGHERWSNYKGYASSFAFDGNHVDPTPSDSESLRRKSALVAIDALPFRSGSTSSQFKEDCVKRELNKAYVGFMAHEGEPCPVAVATGNWGCGAFGGDPRLKCLIQLMAASECKRDIVYFTFGDDKLSEEICRLYEFMSKHEGVTVGSLYKIIVNYYGDVITKQSNDMDLYEYVMMSLDLSCDHSTDEEECTTFSDSTEAAGGQPLSTAAVNNSSTTTHAMSGQDLKQTKLTHFFKPN